MSIQFRADQTSLPTIAPVSTQEAEALKAKVEESLAEILQARDWDEYFDMHDRAQIEILEAKLQSTLALLDHFLATGEWIVPTGSAGPNGTEPGAPVQDLRPGWNGNYTLRNRLEDNSLVEGADYAGTIFIDDDGNPEHAIQLALQLSETATKLEAFNKGKDIIYVETYKDDAGNEKQRYWVGKNQATNVRAKISIDAHTLDHSVKIDLSRVYRISDGSNHIPYGTVEGFVIHGSDYDDEIIGSQGVDEIQGHKGADKLFGMGGDDLIYGDDEEQWARARGSLGLSTELSDADDTIDGGAGKDTIDGGGGIDTVYTSDNDRLLRVDNPVEARGTTPPEESWFDKSNTNGWDWVGTTPGVVEVRETYDPATNENPNTLYLKMPDGYDMAFAEEDPENPGTLKITLVKHNENGPPETFTILVKKALSDRTDSPKDPFTLNFEGNGSANIIDFHSVNFGNNMVDIKGLGSDDMILSPETVLSEDGISFGDLLTPTEESPRELQNILKDVVRYREEAGETLEDDAGKNIKAEPNSEGEIEISRTGAGTDEKQLSINAKDYDKAYYLVDPKKPSDLLVVLIKKGVPGTEPQRVVIRIKDYAKFQGPQGSLRTISNWLHIDSAADRRVRATPNQTGEIPVIPLIYKDVDGDGTAETGVIIDGGDGQDFAFHADEDFLVPGTVESHVSGSHNTEEDD